jgi:acyl carrier protein
MPPHDSILPDKEADFETALLRFINEVLPTLDRRGRSWSPVAADTPLFESGLLDSLSILHLIAQVEQLTGHSVPDHLVLMKHFRSVQAITSTFWKSTVV